MKNTLFYYYHLTPEKIIKKDNYYYFYLDNYIHYLYLVNRPLEYINELIMLTRTVNYSNFMMIIFNVNKEALSIINNRYYILLRSLKNNYFNINDIYNPTYCPKEASNLKLLNHSSWNNLWSSKIDYFEYQKDYIKMKYKTLYKTLDYFIGLGENAISYFNATNSYLTKEFTDTLVISRRRVNLDDLSFYNPLNIVIDNKARDSAEYLKSLFITDNYTYDFLDEFLTNLNYSPYQYGLLIARLLFPSHYFDIYEKIINESLKEKEIIKVLNRTDEYEKFLKYIYNFINKKKPILKIDWLDSN